MCKVRMVLVVMYSPIVLMGVTAAGAGGGDFHGKEWANTIGRSAALCVNLKTHGKRFVNSHSLVQHSSIAADLLDNTVLSTHLTISHLNLTLVSSLPHRQTPSPAHI